MKSKGTAYLLWFFLGILGGHCFYLGKVGKGILYIFTLGLGGIGLLYDLFTLGGQVDTYNALHRCGNSNVNSNVQNVVINMPPQAQATASTATTDENK